MSHIVKGKLSLQYKDSSILKKALERIGTVRENEPLYRVGAGYTRESYDLVLVDPRDTTRRIGFNHEHGQWVQYQEDYGSYGIWTREVSDLIRDNYIAFHYEKQLKEEGYDVTIRNLNNGAIELVAEEACW